MALVSARPARTFVVDPAASRATIIVGKAGLFSFAAGHEHEVEAPSIAGAIELDAADLTQSTLKLTIDARTLRVTGKGEPAKDVPEVQQAMLSDRCLDVAKYPDIAFASSRVTVTKRTGAVVELSVTGVFTIHGQQKSITVPVTADLGADRLTARGAFEIKQTDFGISPISVAGVVKVKNELAISFSIAAQAR
jgi:polyisoprenoid-binding protein YceI